MVARQKQNKHLQRTLENPKLPRLLLTARGKLKAARAERIEDRHLKESKRRNSGTWTNPSTGRGTWKPHQLLDKEASNLPQVTSVATKWHPLTHAPCCVTQALCTHLPESLGGPKGSMTSGPITGEHNTWNVEHEHRNTGTHTHTHRSPPSRNAHARSDDAPERDEQSQPQKRQLSRGWWVDGRRPVCVTDQQWAKWCRSRCGTTSLQRRARGR